MSDQFISIDGVRIHVSVSGQGKPLMLIHGLGGPLMWQKVVEPLSSHFQIIMIDLPGFGDSEGPKRNYSVAEHADVCKQALHHLGLESASLAGISYGGQIAATFASLYPEMIEKLILSCCTGLMKPPLIVSNPVLRIVFSFIAKHFLLKNEKNLCKKGARSFYNIANRPPDLCKNFFVQLSKPGHRDAWLNGVINTFSGGEEFKQLLAKISAPALILWGENDNTVPPEHALEFHRLIPSSQVHTFKECAHSVPLEKAEDMCEMVTSFLRP